MQKRNIHLMLTISFLQGMVFYASIATLYRQALGVTVFEISIIECISMALSFFWKCRGASPQIASVTAAQ